MSKTITAKQLAHELNVNAKTLRGYMRKHHTRSSDAKNTSWMIDAKTANAVRKSFAAKRNA